jgi:hypothetical protein
MHPASLVGCLCVHMLVISHVFDCFFDFHIGHIAFSKLQRAITMCLWAAAESWPGPSSGNLAGVSDILCSPSQPQWHPRQFQYCAGPALTSFCRSPLQPPCTSQARSAESPLPLIFSSPYACRLLATIPVSSYSTRFPYTTSTSFYLCSNIFNVT